MRIFLACADERLRIALVLLFDSKPGMDVVGMTDRLERLAAQIEASQAEALVLEWDLPSSILAERINEIRQLDSSPVIIYLSSEPETAEAMLAAGVDYFIVKNAPPDELITILDDLQTPKPKNHYSNGMPNP
ncbi:MAG: response regulator [Anaerolineales bacterium]